MSWWWSLLLVVGLLAWVVVLVADTGGSNSGSSGLPSEMNVSVVDVTSGLPVAGAEVMLQEQAYSTGDSGVAAIPYPEPSSVIRVVHPDYFPVYGEISDDLASDQLVALSPR